MKAHPLASMKVGDGCVGSITPFGSVALPWLVTLSKTAAQRPIAPKEVNSFFEP